MRELHFLMHAAKPFIVGASLLIVRVYLPCGWQDFSTFVALLRGVGVMDTRVERMAWEALPVHATWEYHGLGYHVLGDEHPFTGFFHP